MRTFQESDAKHTIRKLLLAACGELQRNGLTYLGLPGADATDLRVLGNLLENAICIDKKKTVLDEMRRNLGSLPLVGRKFIKGNIWKYLREEYPSEPSLADVSFLDFCGGGIHDADPFATEIAGIRSYFAKHAHHPQQAFVLAWTFMPRDKGEGKYLETVATIVNDKKVIDALRATKGVFLRAAAVRAVLWQSLREHGMSCSIYHHAVYKRHMNTIILVFSKGADPNCRLALEAPRTVLTEPAFVYDPGAVVPRVVPVLDI